MTVLFRITIVFISIVVFSTTHATDRSSETAVLDVDASGEVDALTDGLLLLRSMFGLSDDALTTGVVSPDCVDCDATKISQYITSVEGKTYADLNSTDDQNISGSSFDGTTLTIGIENGQSETVDLSSLEDGTGITAEQASAIEANTAKVGITLDQAAAISANTAKISITSDQANHINSAISALNCIAALEPPEEEQEEHGDETYEDDEDHDEEHGDDAGSFSNFWVQTQACINDAFEGI
jgi:hypothetical protein